MIELFLQPLDPSFIGSFSSELVGNLSGKLIDRLLDILVEVAIQDFKTWIENIKKINEGNANFDLEYYEKAKRLFEEVIQKEPRSYESWFMRSLCLLLLGDLELSIRSFDQTLNRRKTYQAYHYKSVAQILLQDFDSALDSLEKAIELNSQISEFWFCKARVLEQIGRYEEAINTYDQAIAIKPNNYPAIIHRDLLHNAETTEILIGRSVELIKKSRYEEAVTYINKAIEMNSENAEAWRLRGDILRLNNSYQESILSYKKSIEIDSKLSQAYYGIGLSYYHLKKYRAAYFKLEKTVELDDRLSDAYFYLGIASRMLNYWNKSKTALTHFCELNPTDARGFLEKGHTHRKEGDVKRSQEDHSYFEHYTNALYAYEKVLSIDPSNKNALTCMGDIYFSQYENNEKALELYNRLRDLKPDDHFVQFRIQQLKDRQEQVQKEEQQKQDQESQEQKQEIEGKKKWFGLF